MGAAPYTLRDNQECHGTPEMKRNFIKAVREGRLERETTMVRQGGATAVLEPKLTASGEVAAIALGTYAIFPIRP